jgi:hypothetical protein
VYGGIEGSSISGSGSTSTDSLIWHMIINYIVKCNNLIERVFIKMQGSKLESEVKKILIHNKIHYMLKKIQREERDKGEVAKRNEKRAKIENEEEDG